MLSVEQARDKAEQLVEQAVRAGADGADALYLGELSSGVQVRKGELEDVHRSESEGLGLRVFRGTRSASVSSSDLSADALAILVERALAMAAEAPEDPYAGLAPADLLAKPPFADLDSWDPVEPDPAALKARALEAEGAALAVEGVTNSSGAGASASGSTVAHGHFERFLRRLSRHRPQLLGQRRRRHRIGHGARLCLAQRALRRRSGRCRRDRPARRRARGRAAQSGQGRGGQDAGAVRPARRHHLARPFHQRDHRQLGGAQVELPDGQAGRAKCSRPVCRSTTIRPASAACAAAPSTARGCPCVPMALVEDGILKTWLAESASARQLGIAPTGHAIRGVGGSPGAGPSNLYMAAGKASALTS